MSDHIFDFLEFYLSDIQKMKEKRINFIVTKLLINTIYNEGLQ